MTRGFTGKFFIYLLLNISFTCSCL